MSNNTQNIDTNYDALYNHFYASNLKSYNDTLARFNDGKFGHNDYYMTSKTVDIDIDSTLMDDIMKQYADILANKTHNQINFRLDSYTERNDAPFCSDDITYCISYTEYNMLDISKVDSMAKHLANSAVWKIKYQPNSKEVSRFLDIINNAK